MARRRAALLRRTGRLKVRKRRNHGGDDPGGGDINRRGARRGVVKKSGLIGRGSVVACHYALVHILTLKLDIRVGRRYKGCVDAVTRGTTACYRKTSGLKQLAQLAKVRLLVQI